MGNKLVYFKDLIEENADEQYGILLDDGNIICLCCGGIVEQGEYEIIKYCRWFNFSQAMKDGEI